LTNAPADLPAATLTPGTVTGMTTTTAAATDQPRPSLLRAYPSWTAELHAPRPASLNAAPADLPAATLTPGTVTGMTTTTAAATDQPRPSLLRAYPSWTAELHAPRPASLNAAPDGPDGTPALTQAAS
jgi:hypothetical protein